MSNQLSAVLLSHPRGAVQSGAANACLCSVPAARTAPRTKLAALSVLRRARSILELLLTSTSWWHIMWVFEG